MIQNVFARIEKKFLLTPEQYEALRPVIDRHMSVDKYGIDTIHTIYYDTKDYELIRRSLESPVYKEKLRLRAYGVTVPADKIAYAEIKKKYKGIVYKRREAATAAGVVNWMEQGILPDTFDSQIGRELEYARNFYHPEAKLYLGYHREALFGKEDSELRLTFDTDITWRTEDMTLTGGFYGTPLLPEKRILMEVKVPGAYPDWLLKELEKDHIVHTRFSKYGYWYQTNRQGMDRALSV